MSNVLPSDSGASYTSDFDERGRRLGPAADFTGGVDGGGRKVQSGDLRRQAEPRKACRGRCGTARCRRDWPRMSPSSPRSNSTALAIRCGSGYKPLDVVARRHEMGGRAVVPVGQVCRALMFANTPHATSRLRVIGGETWDRFVSPRCAACQQDSWSLVPPVGTRTYNQLIKSSAALPIELRRLMRSRNLKPADDC